MRGVRVLLAILWLFTLEACVAGGDQPMAPLPAFGEGDAYRFDDGATHQVERASGDTVAWRDSGHLSSVTSRDVLLPPLEEVVGNVQVRRRFTTRPDLFPLRPGRQVAFSAMTERTRHGAPPQFIREDWSCVVGDTVALRSRAGTFDTIRVDCGMRGAAGGPTLARTFFYAPSIGFYVRREDRAANGTTHVMTLTAFTVGNPPLSNGALTQRVRAISRALERQVSGTPVTWYDGNSGARGSVEPVLTVRAAGNQWCREFQETLRTAGRDYDLLGTACREPSGIWQVQQVTPNQIARQ